MLKRRRQPPAKAMDVCLDEFANMIEGWISYGTMTRAVPLLSADDYRRLVRAVDHMQTALAQLHRQITTARMLGEQLRNNDAPEAVAYIIQDDTRLILRRGDLPTGGDNGAHD